MNFKELLILFYILAFNIKYQCQVTTVKVAMVSDGLPNDIGYNYQANQALVAIQIAKNMTTMNFFGNISTDDCFQFVSDLIMKQGYTMIIGISPPFEDSLRTLSNKHLDIYFIFTTGGPMVVPKIAQNSSRIQSIFIVNEIISYICGYYAGAVTKTGKIGFVGAGPPSRSFPANIFYMGARRANPTVTLDYFSIPGGQQDPNLSEGATINLINRNIDVVGQNIGDLSVTFTTLLQGKIGIGTNGFNQTKIFGKLIPFSYTINFTSAYLFVLEKALLNQTFNQKWYRGDFLNNFFTLVFNGPQQLTKEQDDEIKLILPKMELSQIYCDPYIKYLYKVSNSIPCINSKLVYNMSDPFPGMRYHGNFSFGVSLQKSSKSVTKIFTIISSILILLSVILSTSILIFRKRSTFRNASPIFCILIIIGGIIVYSGVIIWVVPVTKITCNMRLWLVSEGFTILIGTMVVKSFRVWILFNSNGFNSIQLTNLHLLPWIFILIVMNSFIMIIISYRGGVQVIDIYGVDNLSKYEYLHSCSMNQIGWISLYALLCYFALLMTIGLFVGWKSRNSIIYELNDSKTIANTLYTIAFGLTIIISLIVSPQTYQNQTIIFSISALFMVTLSLIMLFFPKVFYLKTAGPQYRKSNVLTLRYETSNRETYLN